MSQAVDSDHFRLSVDTSRARKFSQCEVSSFKNKKTSTVLPDRKDSFAGFKINSARGK
jgi:hypothetical protein